MLLWQGEVVLKNCKVVKNGEMVTMPIPSEDIKKYYDENRCRVHNPEET